MGKERLMIFFHIRFVIDARQLVFCFTLYAILCMFQTFNALKVSCTNDSLRLNGNVSDTRWRLNRMSIAGVISSWMLKHANIIHLANKVKPSQRLCVLRGRNNLMEQNVII